MLSKTLPSTVSQCLEYRGLDSPTESTALTIMESMSRYFLILANAGTIEYADSSTVRRFKYCYHFRDRFADSYFNPDPDRVTDGYCWDGPWCKATYQASPTTYRHVVVRGTHKLVKPYAPPPVTIEAAINRESRVRAWAALYPDINDGFSLINFIWELKEAPELVLSVMRLWKQLHRCSQFINADKPAAEALLSYNYGYAPTFSDLKAIWDAIFNLKKRINDFIEEGKKAQPYHYREVVDGTEVIKPTYYGFFKETRGKTIYCATALLSYDYDPKNAIRRILGTDLTLERLWNVLPFSFLLDYIVDISKALGSLEHDQDVKVRVHDYCDSIKLINRNEYYFDHNICTNSLTDNWRTRDWEDFNFDIPLWYWESSRYLRVPSLPETGYALPLTDSPSGRELVLVGALLRSA